MTKSTAREPTHAINLFCVPTDEAFRVHVRPTWLPRYLHQGFDRHGETELVELDFEELSRQLSKANADCYKHESPLGIELKAQGPAAGVLASWLGTAFASGLRGPGR